MRSIFGGARGAGARAAPIAIDSRYHLSWTSCPCCRLSWFSCSSSADRSGDTLPSYSVVVCERWSNQSRSASKFLGKFRSKMLDADRRSIAINRTVVLFYWYTALAFCVEISTGRAMEEQSHPNSCQPLGSHPCVLQLQSANLEGHVRCPCCETAVKQKVGGV